MHSSFFSHSYSPFSFENVWQLLHSGDIKWSRNTTSIRGCWLEDVPAFIQVASSIFLTGGVPKHLNVFGVFTLMRLRKVVRVKRQS